MTDEEFMRKLSEAFAVEAGEHLQAMTAGLLELERSTPGDAQRELIETTFREAHSMKGAARAVNRTDIEMVCQTLESVFATWKQQPFTAAPEVFDVLNRAVDLVTRLVSLAEVAQSSSDQEEITRSVQELGGLQKTHEQTRQGSEGGRVEEMKSKPAPREKTEPEAAPRSLPIQISEKIHAAETVRISVEKLDAVLLQAEEMVSVKLAAAQNATDLREIGGRFEAWRKQSANAQTDLASQQFIAEIEKSFRGLQRRSAEDERTLAMQIDALLEDAKQLVMLPFSTLLDVFPKQVRDLARDQGKEIELVLEGRDIEIDKRILEELKTPLIHLVRNAVDHGIEKPEAREKSGKPARAWLTISVSQREGNKVEITIRDDGEGIDVAQVKASAIKNGVVTTADAEALDDKAALGLIFQSGVSTSPIITELSGRGLGMAIVREKIENLGGQIAIETEVKAGTTFRISLPVTLATFKGVLVAAGGQTFVIPTAGIERIVRVRPDEIGTVEGKETIAINAQIVSLVRLDDVLDLPRQNKPGDTDFTEVLVLAASEKRIGFAVDTVLHEQEVLVKNLNQPLARVRNIAGATILASGTPLLILHVPDLLKSAVRASGSGRSGVVAAKSPADAAVRNVLVVDDSVTSRMLLKNILESAGYNVTTAVDGVDGFTAARERDFDVVISDVEMPRMDGFELTSRLRADARLSEIPVVLVTALGSREHQERGIDAGANAYITKGSFDQTNLLEVIRRFV